MPGRECRIRSQTVARAAPRVPRLLTALHLFEPRCKHQFLSASAFTPTFARCSSPFFFPAAATAFLSASAFFVYRRPCAPRRFLATQTALFVTALNLRCPAFLFGRVFPLTPSCHKITSEFSCWKIASRSARGFIDVLSIYDRPTIRMQNLPGHVG
jgi:hypothetical protein